MYYLPFVDRQYRRGVEQNSPYKLKIKSAYKTNTSFPLTTSRLVQRDGLIRSSAAVNSMTTMIAAAIVNIPVHNIAPIINFLDGT